MAKQIEVFLSVITQLNPIAREVYDLSDDFESKTEDEKTEEIQSCVDEVNAEYIQSRYEFL